jgi:hypothetical protein
MTFQVFTEPVIDMLNKIARGETKDVFVIPDALIALMRLQLVEQEPPPEREFKVTLRGWMFVTCPRALALKRLRDATPDDARVAGWVDKTFGRKTKSF